MTAMISQALQVEVKQGFWLLVAALLVAALAGFMAQSKVATTITVTDQG